jgi:hypothetical protein
MVRSVFKKGGGEQIESRFMGRFVGNHSRVGVAVTVTGKPGAGFHNESGGGRDVGNGTQVAALDAPGEIGAEFFEQSTPSSMVVERGQFGPIVGRAFEHREDAATVGDTGVEFVEYVEKFRAGVFCGFSGEGVFQNMHLRLSLELAFQASENGSRWRRLERQVRQFLKRFLLERGLQDEIEQGFFAFDVGVECPGSDSHFPGNVGHLGAAIAKSAEHRGGGFHELLQSVWWSSACHVLII